MKPINLTNGFQIVGHTPMSAPKQADGTRGEATLLEKLKRGGPLPVKLKHIPLAQRVPLPPSVKSSTEELPLLDDEQLTSDEPGQDPEPSIQASTSTAVAHGPVSDPFPKPSQQNEESTAPVPEVILAVASGSGPHNAGDPPSETSESAAATTSPGRPVTPPEIPDEDARIIAMLTASSRFGGSHLLSHVMPAMIPGDPEEQGNAGQPTGGGAMARRSDSSVSTRTTTSNSTDYGSLFGEPMDPHADPANGMPEVIAATASGSALRSPGGPSVETSGSGAATGEERSDSPVSIQTTSSKSTDNRSLSEDDDSTTSEAAPRTIRGMPIEEFNQMTNVLRSGLSDGGLDRLREVMPETFARTYARGPFAGMLGSGAATDRAAPVTPPGLPAVLWHQVADELRTQEQGRSLADLSLASRGARQIVREHLELHRYVQRFETALDSGSSLDRIMDDMLPVVYGGRDAGELTGGGVLSLPPDQREEMLKRMFKLTATHNYPKVYERLLEAIQTLPAPSQARVLTHAANNFGVNEHYAAEALMGNFRTPVAAIPELPARQQVAPLQALYDRSEWVRSVQAAQGEDMPRGWTIVRRVVAKAANKLEDGVGEELKAHIRNNPPDRGA